MYIKKPDSFRSIHTVMYLTLASLAAFPFNDVHLERNVPSSLIVYARSNQFFKIKEIKSISPRNSKQYVHIYVYRNPSCVYGAAYFRKTIERLHCDAPKGG